MLLIPEVGYQRSVMSLQHSKEALIGAAILRCKAGWTVMPQNGV